MVEKIDEAWDLCACVMQVYYKEEYFATIALLTSYISLSHIEYVHS
jgi:hypothetical protein